MVIRYTYLFFAVLAEFLKALAVGAPLVPGLRIVSLEPAFIRFRFAFILAYNPATRRSSLHSCAQLCRLSSCQQASRRQHDVPQLF